MTKPPREVLVYLDGDGNITGADPGMLAAIDRGHTGHCYVPAESVERIIDAARRFIKGNDDHRCCDGSPSGYGCPCKDTDAAIDELRAALGEVT